VRFGRLAGLRAPGHHAHVLGRREPPLDRDVVNGIIAMLMDDRR